MQRSSRTHSFVILVAFLLLSSLATTASAGHSSPGRLGIEVVDLTPELAEHLGAPDGGVLIDRVAPDGAAARAGLQVGDIVTEIEGRRVDSHRELLREVRFFDAGETVQVVALRDGTSLDFAATLDEARRHHPRTRVYGSHRGDVEIDVDVAELLEGLSEIGLVVGANVGQAMADIDWDELGEEIRETVEESLEGLEDLEIDLGDLEIELEGELEDLEREMAELQIELDGDLRDLHFEVDRHRDRK